MQYIHFDSKLNQNTKMEEFIKQKFSGKKITKALLQKELDSLNIKYKKNDTRLTLCELLYTGHDDASHATQTSRRKPIPKAVRIKVWDKDVGSNSRVGKCFVCENEIRIESFECGHIIASAHGGNESVDNLKAICSLCNKSMGTTNLIEYKNTFFDQDDPMEIDTIMITPEQEAIEFNHAMWYQVDNMNSGKMIADSMTETPQFNHAKYHLSLILQAFNDVTHEQLYLSNIPRECDERMNSRLRSLREDTFSIHLSYVSRNGSLRNYLDTYRDWYDQAIRSSEHCVNFMLQIKSKLESFDFF